MRIDPKTLPDGTVIETVHGTLRYLNGVYNPSEWGHEVTRVFVPAPEGMTYADAEAALADAGAWVEVPDTAGLPAGTVFRSVWRKGSYVTDHTYVHRDDLPPTDPDADVIEVIEKSVPIGSWVPGREVLRRLRAEGFDVTHEAKS